MILGWGVQCWLSTQQAGNVFVYLKVKFISMSSKNKKLRCFLCFFNFDVLKIKILPLRVRVIMNVRFNINPYIL